MDLEYGSYASLWFELIAPSFGQNIFTVLQVGAQLQRLAARAFDLERQTPSTGNRVSGHGLLDELSFGTDGDDGFHRRRLG